MPEEFLENKLKNLIDFRSGYTWRKEQESLNPVQGSVRVLTVSNIQQELDLSSELYLMNVPEKEKLEKKAERGWSIAVGSNGNRKRIGNAVYINNDDEYLFASFLVGFKPKPESGLHPQYFYQWLISYPVQERITVVSEGTTGLGNLNIRHFRNMRIRYPKKYSDQEAIVRIFETLDETLKATQNSIAQAQRLKKALMQHLLSGRLKPDGTWRKPDEFYVDEKFGLVPIDWQVKKLKDLGRFTNGVNFKADQMGMGKLFVNLDDIFRSKIIDCSKLERVNVNNTQNLNLIPGDLILVRSSVKLEGIGLPALFTGHTEDIIFCGFVIRYRFDQEKVFPKFLLNLLLSEQYRRKTISLGQIAANTNVSQKALGGLRIAIPKDYQEQEQIAFKLNQIDNFIEIKKYKITKLEKLKKSLMQNLLTGKIRVQAE